MHRKLLTALTTVATSVAIVIGSVGLPAHAAAKSPVSVVDTNAILINELSDPYPEIQDRLFINWNSRVSGARPGALSDNTGTVKTFAYTDTGWLFNVNTDEQYSSFTRSEVLQFDAANRITTHAYALVEDGVADEWTASAQNIQYALNKKGQATKLTSVLDGTTEKKTITYDKLGRVSKIKGSNIYATDLGYGNFTNSFTYKNGYVVSMKTYHSAGDYTDVYTFNYDANGNLSSVSYDSYGTATVSAVYDAQGRLTQLTDTGYFTPKVSTFVY